MATGRLLVTDQAQSVLASLGGVLNRPQAYEIFGYRKKALAETMTGFNGQVPEGITEQYFLGNGYRSYSPALKRFMSPDALSPFAKGGLSVYAYCQGDPVNASDPTGRFPVGIVGGALAGAGVVAGAVGLALYFGSDRPSSQEAGVILGIVGTVFVVGAAGVYGFGSYRESRNRNRRAREARRQMWQVDRSTNPADPRVSAASTTSISAIDRGGSISSVSRPPSHIDATTLNRFDDQPPGYYTLFPHNQGAASQGSQYEMIPMTPTRLSAASPSSQSRDIRLS